MSKSEDDDDVNVPRAQVIRRLRGTGRRGRPPKKNRRREYHSHQGIGDGVNGPADRVAGSAMQGRQAYAPLDQKPREERHYQEFYPLLDTGKSIKVVRSLAQGLKDEVEESEMSDQPGIEAEDSHIDIMKNEPANTPHVQIARSVQPMTSEDVSQIMARAPKPSYRKIDTNDDDLVPDSTFDSFGYNADSDYEHPQGHYVRSIEPTEKELANRVEYDMDEQDDAWLRQINVERRKEQMDGISNEAFEVIMDKLEKEWFDLMKSIPPPETEEELSPEDSACNICDDTEAENSNAIVFCDGCNLAVHQDCYGVPYIPEGQWLCRKCMISPENPVSCIFCPNEGGAFKQTTNNKWGHLLCAIWIPEVGISNTVYMEPIDNIEQIPKSRWKLTCYICRQRMGACIQCDNRSCFTAFHVTCARKAKLFIKMKTYSAHMDGGTLRAFCDKHSPSEDRDEAALAVQKAQAAFRKQSKLHLNGHPSESDDDYDDSDDSYAGRNRKKHNSAKSKAAYQHSYTSGAPLVPQLLLDKILAHTSKITMRKKINMITLIAKYWSLKRESRRGAPLLKRLHLEPWTAYKSDPKATEAEKLKKLEFIVTLRKDLERLRMLAELVRKREREKLRRIQTLQSAVDMVIFPTASAMSRVLERMMKLDKNSLFLHPVVEEEAPDYYKIVMTPMNFSEIKEKVDNQEYDSFEAFCADVNLVFSNAMLYNKPDTIFYKTASRLKAAAQAEYAKEMEGLSLLTIDEYGMADLPLEDDFFEYQYELEEEPEPEPAPTLNVPKSRKGRKSAIREPSSRATRSRDSKDGSGKAPGNDQPEHLPKGWAYETDEEEPQRSKTDGNLNNRDLFAHFNDGWVLNDRRRKTTNVYASNTANSVPNDTGRNKSKEISGQKIVEDATSRRSKRGRDENETVKASSVKAPASDKAKSAKTKAKALQFKIGDLVWAKMKGFPWHPAEVCDASDSKLKKDILGTRTEEDDYLVYFFDDKIRTWRFLPSDKLVKLGQDDALDQSKLKDKAIKTPKARKNVRSSYEMALERIKGRR